MDVPPTPPDPTSSTALRMVGADVLGLLHRISTNAVADLLPGQARATLFCDFRGRLLHRAILAATADGAVWMLRDDAPGAPLATFLDRHVFRDDVRIEDRSSQLPVRVAADLAGSAPGMLSEERGVPIALQVAGGESLVVGHERGAGSGAERDGGGERLRVRAGRPAHGHEIVETFTPFEVGLAHEVHLDKGCFTGQEALMRLITYHSVRRRLARVAAPGPTPAVPADLASGGRPAGVLTSAVADGDGWIGLAVLRHDVCEPPAALELPGPVPVSRVEPLARTRPLGRG